MAPRPLRSLWVVLIVVFGFAAAACGGASDGVESASVADSHTSAAELFAGDFVDLDGQTIDLASFEGRDVVLWFWAPW